MQDIKKFEKVIYKYWKEAIGKELPLPGEARVVTGIPRNDSFLHHMLTEHGVDIELIQYQIQQTYATSWKMTDYKIVDDKKYSWFLLRWE